MKDVVLFTSESVCEGHPDKICDLIADNILDEALRGDPMSRVACEVCCTTGMVMIMGEFTTEQYIDIPGVVRRVVKQIGYDKPELGFDCHTCAVLTYINQQSPDIARGVDCAGESESGIEADKIGAGDQGMMFGYATNETEELMPLPLTLSHKLTKALTDARKSGLIDYLRPDGKAQVTVAYKEGVPQYVTTVVLSCQHNPDVEMDRLRKDVLEKIIIPTIGKKYLTEDTEFFINPTGRFVTGGPHGDSGLTGRKIIVDTYGGMCPHGGGSFSGKDATKVDRSASYYARYVCKNVVKAGLADRIQLSVAYAIGRAHPVSIGIDCFGTAKVEEEKLLGAIKRVFDFRPYSIIQSLGLRRPIYAASTNYGHFGKADMPWEQTDKTEELKEAVK